MHKNALLQKSPSTGVGAPPPDPLPSGGWGLFPQTPANTPPLENPDYANGLVLKPTVVDSNNSTVLNQNSIILKKND